MLVYKKTQFSLAILIVAMLGAHVGAQVWQPFGPVDFTHDLQPFKTFEMRNFSDRPAPHEGFFFSFDKLSWAIQGERTVIGSPNAQAVPVDLFPGAPNPNTDFPLMNGLTSTPPNRVFAGGERYEFGYVVGHHGWLASVLDGPSTNEVALYGNVNGVAPNAPGVAILFEAPAGLLDGFKDTIPNPVAFDTLVTFITTFASVNVTAQTQLHGIELMKTYRFKPSHRGSSVEFYYGARYFRLRDDFRVDTTGGTIGDSFWDTRITNHIVGPQVGMKWFQSRGRWTINAQGRFTFGYNIQNLDQDGLIGANLNPGAVNVPMFLNPTAFTHGQQDQEFSPLAEMRIEASYHLTKAVALKLGWTGTFVDNIRRASQNVNYTLPEMGFVRARTQDFFANGAHVSIEVNH